MLANAPIMADKKVTNWVLGNHKYCLESFMTFGWHERVGLIVGHSLAQHAT
jgi:hypothetical protein